MDSEIHLPTNAIVGALITAAIGALGWITVDFTGTTLKGNAGADWVPVAGDALVGVYNGTNWYCQIIDAMA